MKQLLRSFCLLTLGFSACHLATADSMEFGLSSDMVEMAYEANFGTSYISRLNYLHADQDEFKSNSFGAGLFASGVSGRFTTHLGGKLYWMEDSDTRSYGIGLGGSVDMAITPEFSISTGIIYSPEIINGGDYEQYYDFDIRASYKVMKHASLYVAYRNNEASNDDFDFEIYKGGVLGFKFAL
ncbi:MAG: hypothetical protein HRU20_07000 [Pseudomonadales bacterium]|nr:hypothetical protein [Pseudomonadales bacterium]